MDKQALDIGAADGFTDTAEQQNPLLVSPTEPVRFWRARSN